MKTFWIYGILCFLIATILILGYRAYSQTPNYYQQQAIWTFAGVPTGGCNGYPIAEDTLTGNLWTCKSGGWIGPMIAPLVGTTGTITGTLLAVGACDSGTATVTGATVGMVAKTQASDGTGLLAVGFTVDAVVTSANTVTVYVCADILGTPPSKTYTVRVIP